MDKTEKLIEEYEKYAKNNGLRLNLDKKALKNIINALIEREKSFGEKYCPCRRITGDKEQDKEIICPCKFMKKEIGEKGHCLCNLFFKKE